MISSVSYERSTWASVPHKFEAGTPPILEGIGLKAAIDYVQTIGYEAIAAHETALVDHALARIGAIEGVQVIGRAQSRRRCVVRGGSGTCTRCRDAARSPGDCGARGTSLRGTADAPVWAGYTARASFAVYTTREEIDFLADSLERVREFFK